MSCEWNWEVALDEVIRHIGYGTHFLTLDEKLAFQLKAKYMKDFESLTDEGRWKEARRTVLPLAEQIGADAERATIRLMWAKKIKPTKHLDHDATMQACMIVARVYCKAKFPAIKGAYCQEFVWGNDLYPASVLDDIAKYLDSRNQ